MSSLFFIANSSRATSVGSPMTFSFSPIKLSLHKIIPLTKILASWSSFKDWYIFKSLENLTISILFWVNVPVLSLQITSQLPSVSTAFSRLTIAPRLAKFCKPIAIIIVITAGRLSGIAATARVTETKNAFKISMVSARKISTKKITTAIIKTAIVIIFPTFLIDFSRGVKSLFVVFKYFAILPISVFIPISVTTPLPRPKLTTVDEYAQFILSASGVLSFKTQFASFEVDTDSPVKALSSHFKLWVSINLKSAGTMSPASKITISPIVKDVVLIFLTFPSRNTLQYGSVLFFKLSSASSALLSCIVPIIAFKITIKKITPPSNKSL